MGLISAALGAAESAMRDQWLEFFTCDSIPVDILCIKGQKKDKTGNNKGNDNVISNGSGIVVADGQCMIIVENGKVVDICAEPGQYTYDQSSEPSLFYGKLSENIGEVFKMIGKRFVTGGEIPKDQRVYYFNTKEIIGNKYGTASPVPYRVVDTNIGLDMDIAVKCFGEYSYKIVDPILFYTNICSNVSDSYSRAELDGQLKSEFLTALQGGFARISELGIRYSALPGHALELADAMNQELSNKWGETRGIEVVSVGVTSIKANEEDEQTIKDLQKQAVFRNANMAAAGLASAQADAMRAAAANESAGPMMAFAGMNMAANAGGMNAQQLFAMGQQQAPAQAAPAPAAAPVAAGWTCTCGATGNVGNFCAECGKAKPETLNNGWTCSCGTFNKGKFCSNCGTAKPAEAPKYKCDKCGWEPEDPFNPPKFCPECGDPFNEADIVK